MLWNHLNECLSPSCRPQIGDLREPYPTLHASPPESLWMDANPLARLVRSRGKADDLARTSQSEG